MVTSRVDWGPANNWWNEWWTRRVQGIAQTEKFYRMFWGNCQPDRDGNEYFDIQKGDWFILASQTLKEDDA